MNDRDCSNCKHKTPNGCESWDCKFEKKSDLISREVYEQIRWERDTAIQQLKDLGYSLGEKPRQGDLIYRAEAINVMCRKVCGIDYCGCATDCKEIKEMMELPSAERTGEWIYDGTYYKCSVCEGLSYVNSFNYCPNCGAKMEGETE